MTIARRLGFVRRSLCPLCGSSNLRIHLSLDGFDIAACDSCGFAFSQDVLDSTALNQFYVEGYHDQRHIDGQTVNATVNLRVLKKFIGDLRGKSVLDVGSGYGFLVNELRAQGAGSVTGVELSRVERDHATRRLMINTVKSLDDLPPNAQFDVVTAFEVIEHVPDPRCFVRALGAFVRPGGSLVIGTDNFFSGTVNTLGAVFPKWIPHEHISFFSGQTLSHVLESAPGFRIAGALSYTAWELRLREFLYKATSGRRGGKPYSYPSGAPEIEQAGFRYFRLRLIANRIWFDTTSRRDLNGAMMFVHALRQ